MDPLCDSLGPDFVLETETGQRRVAGLDEAGRGPWAGPVTAAAVVLDPDDIPEGLDDSKKLSPKKREALFELVMVRAAVGIGHATVAEIDRMNILHASMLAMTRALAALPLPPDAALVDGNRVPRDLSIPAHAVVGGDARSLSIAAASIVAKVTRDRIMRALSLRHPGYGWERNMGYGTSEHRVSLFRHGVTPEHRRSFRPIHNILYQDDFLTP